MKYPDWCKQFREVEMVGLKGASGNVRAIYHYLRVHSPGFECEPVKGLTVRDIATEMGLGKSTVHDAIKELQKRKLIEKIVGARKDGIKFQFIFDYPNSTIKTIEGRVTIIVPATGHKNNYVRSQEHTVPTTGHTVPVTGQLPYIEERESIYNALREQVAQKLRDLHIFTRIFEPIIESPFGTRFAQEILTNYPNENGPVIRKKLEDDKNVNLFKVIDMFRREGQKTPTGTSLIDSKTGEVGEWEWCGKIGKIHLEQETVIIQTLAEFRAWEAA